MIAFRASSPSSSAYFVKKKIKEIGSVKGRGTELLTLYLPASMRLSEVMNRLNAEKGEAGNIKSSVTRERVLEAIARSLSLLKLYKDIPKNGLCLFVGRVGEEKSSQLMEWVFEPPIPVRSFIYKFSERFFIEPLTAELSNQKAIGILAIDNTETGIGLLRGEYGEVLKVLTSGVGGSTKKGGSSSRRYERDRESRLIQYYNRVAAAANNILLNELKVQALIVGGPGFTKDEFLSRNLLDYRLKKMLLGTVDSEYSGHEGVRSVITRSAPLLKESRHLEESALVQRLLKEIGDASGRALLGANSVKRGIEKGSANVVMVLEGRKEIEELDELCLLHSISLEIVSASSEAGRMLEGLGGVAAITK